MCRWPAVVRPTLLFAALMAGCAPKYTGYGPHFDPMERRIQRVAVVVPELYCYDVSEGGVQEYRTDWSRAAQAQVRRALELKLLKKGFDTVVVSDSLDTTALPPLKSFTRFTSRAIQQHLYGQNAFLPQIDTCDYSLGSLAAICSLVNADAIIMVYGADEHFSPEHVRLLKTSADIKTARSACLGVVTGMLLGVATYRVYQVPQEQTFLCCTIADATGQIIYYHHYLNRDNADLQNFQHADRVTGEVLSKLNRRSR